MRRPIMIAAVICVLSSATVLPQSELGSLIKPINLAIGSFAAGQGPVAIATGDFNNDYILDLAVANFGTPEDRTPYLSILLGDGRGGFGEPVPVLGNYGEFIVTADFNRDGNLDLAAANPGPDTVAVLLGDGNGNFGPPTNLSPGASNANCRSIAVGDFNRDSKLDLAVANASNNTVSVFLGDGTGGFAPAKVFPAGDGPTFVAAADFNRDGKLDLAVSDQNTGAAGILLGDGKGNFSSPVSFPANYPVSVVVGDFNNDGKQDLAVANPGPPTVPGPVGVSVLLGDGRGTFGSPILTTGVAPGLITDFEQHQPLAAGDFDLDGRLDLAVAQASSNSVVILFGTGTGSFSPTGLTIATNLGPVAVTAGKLDRDYRLDLVVANAQTDKVTVVLNRPAFHR